MIKMVNNANHTVINIYLQQHISFGNKLSLECHVTVLHSLLELSVPVIPKHKTENHFMHQYMLHDYIYAKAPTLFNYNTTRSLPNSQQSGRMTFNKQSMN